MILEMLAGDELAPTDPTRLRATGFLARNWYKFNRNVWMQDTVEHTAKAFLGMTVNCARCHDHKYDPISQEEYYRVRAFFEPYDVRTDRVAGQPDVNKDGLARIFDGDATAQTFRLKRGDVQNPDKDNPISPGVLEVLGNTAIHIEPVVFPLEAYYPDFRSFVHADLVAQGKEEIKTAEANLAKAHEALVDERTPKGTPALPERASANPSAESVAQEEPAEKLRKAQASILLAEKELAAARASLPALEARIAADKAKYASPADPDVEALALKARQAEREANVLKAEAKVVRAQQQLAEALSKTKPDDKIADDKKVAEARKELEAAVTALTQSPDGYTPVGKTYPGTSTGRRLALARWIASKQNPLTARVAINHIWLRHFGRALVPTVFDFGKNGKPPTHPELLDWLAVTLMENNWGTKAIHRTIVTSNSYRMRSAILRSTMGW